MNPQPQTLLSIGSFSSAARLSLKALRLYDQLDLLKPSYVDPDSGYRYYQVTQLQQARLIRMMRQMELPLATIGRILVAAPADAEQIVRDCWQAREKQMEQIRRMIPDLIAYLHQEETAMALEVNVRTIDAQPILSMAQRVQVEQLSVQICTSVQMLYELAKQQKNPVVGAPFGIYHAPINHDDDGPIEVCVPVQHLSPSTTADVTSRILNGGKGAAVLLEGEQCKFPTILAGYDAASDWIRQNGYEAIEPPREIWHRSSEQEEQMEVVWLFR
ncbi:MerR family transcriptional regulator [Phormidium tenue FACHB-886]|nr:MerR family transcriptional regulator [Phormidium tenue FACHB-886]